MMALDNRIGFEVRIYTFDHHLPMSLRTGGLGNSGRKTVVRCVATDGSGR